MNLPLITSFSAIIFAQLIKWPIAFFSNRNKARLSIITSTGGMPSSHSAAVSSLITALVFEYGFASPFVAIATVFGVIVIFDSMGVRRQTGDQGMVLDILAKRHLAQIEDAEKHITLNQDSNPNVLDYSITEYDRMIINRYFGHKPTEVVAGVFTGGIVAFIVYNLFFEFF